MYSLNQRVSNLTIVGIVTSEVFITNIGLNNNFTNLDLVDKDWRQKPVYIVKFDEPQKNITIEGLQRIYPDMNYIDIKNKHDSLPLYKFEYIIESAIGANVNEN